MNTLGRLAVGALVGALVGGGVLWYRSREAPPPQAATAAARQAAAPPAALMPPPETFASVFTPCAHCHEIGRGARAMVGPPLTGVIGRKAGSIAHYPYSQAMRDSGITWDAATLARFIADPQTLLPGTRMVYGGVPQKDIGALVSFIATAGRAAAGEQREASRGATPGAKGEGARSLPASTLAIGGPFTLVDSMGRKVTQNDLLGKPSVMFFGYTNCPDICPTTLANLTRMMNEMGADADKLNVVFITIDPARDTSAQLADYISSFDPRIRAFTGSDAEIAQVAKEYHVYYRRVPSPGGGYSMDHTATVFLMDAKGGFVGTLTYQEDDKTSLAKLERLVHLAS